ncbi:ketoacyl-ACP synthase III family protein [Nucisporomicrobium flavum]|uniref:ketoacyl-ACP synthase III family protein n=1 Tax=Nucisporomicrobium flavum TaxID=2785915 RepID=UPI0018F3FF8E|nr:ketoacyl-ACP synthase III family protein [Nucisporomicrobium flavum]
MKWDSLYFAGVGTYLPPPAAAGQAVADGLYPATEFRTTAMLSALQEEKLEAVDMAVASAGQALERASADPADILLLLHSSLGQWSTGQDVLTPASYIQRRTLGGHAPSMYVNSASNGGMASVELAADWLAVRDPHGQVLITSASRFAPPFDRWRTDTGLIYGDGAASVVLSGTGGFARILATRSDSASELEPIYRAAGAEDDTLDMAARKRDFVGQRGPAEVLETLQATVGRNVRGVLEEAGTEMDQVARFVLPNVGRPLIRLHYGVPLRIGLDRTLWRWGRTVGHIGSSDQFAGLAHLVESRAVAPGDRVVLLGLGAGFNLTSAVVEILDLPDWTAVPGSGSTHETE